MLPSATVCNSSMSQRWTPGRCPDGWIDVARHGDVDQQQRASGASGHRGFDHRTIDNESGRRGGRDDDVGGRNGAAHARRTSRLRRSAPRRDRWCARPCGSSPALRLTPLFASAAAVSLPASPAPTTRTVRPERSPSVLRASATAVELTETACRPISVCVRALRPTRIAVWNRREIAGVCVPAAVAAVNAPRTCPRISDSPTTIDSTPAATRNRCRAASRPVSAKNGAPSMATSPLSSLSSATMGRASPTPRALAMYTSVRLHVEMTAAPAYR